jgi:hypothetical protein
MAEAAQSLPHQVMKSRDGGEPGTPGFSQQDHLPFSSWRSVTLTLVRSFLAFSNLSISIFWALARETRQDVLQGCLKQFVTERA